MDKKFDLLKKYLHQFIDEMRPVSTDYQIKKYSKRGYIENGHNGNFIPFKTWLTLNT